MTNVRHVLAGGDFFQDWSDANLITTSDDWSGVPSIVGYRGDDVITATGVDPRTITGAGTSEVVLDVTANQVNPTTVTAGGVIEFDAIPNRTIALNGSGTADAPSIVVYLDATGRENIRFQALIRDLDASADNAIQQVAVQWRVGGGNWNNVAYIADATTAGSATQETPVDVILPSGANNAADLEIRIITTNAAGNDEAIGIDDIRVSSSASNADTTPPQLAGFNPTDPDDGDVAVDAAGNIVLRFTEAVQAGTGSFTLSNGTDVRTIAINDPQVSISGNTVTINPATDLAAGTTYSLTAPAGILTDLAGNAFAGLAAGALDFTVANPLQVITIGEIQGLGHTSAFVGAQVRTEGVVTAIDTNGFYIQSAAGATDGDIRTSDAIFVFTSAAPTGIAKGDLLRVDATVTEFRPGGDARNLTITQLTTPSFTKVGTGSVETTLIGTGGRLPPTAVYEDDGFTSYDPATDGLDFYESLEGMLITIDAPMAVSNTNSFRETFVVASGGAGATGINSRGGITISDGDFNPERIQLDDDSGLFAGFTNSFTVGDRLSSVTGIVSYAFQSYEVLVTEAVTTVVDVTNVKEVTTLSEGVDRVSAATYNLANVSAVSSAAKIASIASDIVNNLKSPDIIGVQEIQDANGSAAGGSLSGIATANAIIAAIQAAGGPTYAYVEVAPTAPNTTGGEPNGNIRNGFFYDPSRVTLVPGSVQIIDDPIYAGTRRPLVASFSFNGEVITLINMHSTSRGGSDGLQSANQPPNNAGDAARTAQAAAVKAFIDGRLAVDPAAKIAVLGDLNGFTWEAAIQQFTSGGALRNLSDLLAPEERFSFNFEGNSQQLDHIIATRNLFDVAQFDAVHLNSDLPPAQQLSTDHDAMLALFEIPVPLVGNDETNTINGTQASERIQGLGGNDRLNGNRGNDVVEGGEGNDILSGGSGVNQLLGGAGNDQFGETQAGTQKIDGGAGIDLLNISSPGSTVVVDMAAGTLSGGYYDAGSTITGVENVRVFGSGFAITAIGDGAANTFTGGNLGDTLLGGGGNDRLIGALGADILGGGSGNDVFEFRRGEVEGDQIIDFDGQGSLNGDVLVFRGFGPGAFITNGGSGNVWTVFTANGEAESFIMNVESLAPGDVLFVG